MFDRRERGTFGAGGPGRPGAGRPDKMGPGPDTFLADALDITTDKLAAAMETARLAGVQQALDKGLITQEQADAMRSRQGPGGPGGHFLPKDTGIDKDALLAQALGVTTETLKQAHSTAWDARLAQDVKDGKITQEQADLMKARAALHKYMEQKDFYGSVVAQAVKDGVITQAQADAILAESKGGRPGFGPGGPGGRPGFGPGGPGGRPGGPQGRRGGPDMAAGGPRERHERV